ncbi:cyclase family protein [Salinibacter ruber]|uniref:cyclase family protein n=1 Tax=Salinibacter ruber TaxID=146919 RepID=UPI002169C321|nr:cyclase family protein [Salinibacter ruber]MCS3783579.1 arylformamidase [Salinibacter ruber]
MSNLIDISVSLDENLPTWPGSPGFELEPLQTREEGGQAMVSRLECDVHTGTHIDAPLHFIPDGSTIEQIPIEATVGTAVVVRVPDAVTTITASTLDELDIPKSTTRLLFHTKNSSFWSDYGSVFQAEYTALSPSAATWIVEHGIRCVGVDYLSVQHYEDGPETHEILLRGGIVIIEGLDLSGVSRGGYELLCLPVKIVGGDGAPARAALRETGSTEASS